MNCFQKSCYEIIQEPLWGVKVLKASLREEEFYFCCKGHAEKGMIKLQKLYPGYDLMQRGS